MLRFSHSVMIVLCGAVWFAVGAFLLPLGLKLMLNSVDGEEGFPLIHSLAPHFGGAQQAALILIAICLYVGYCKSKFVLSKSVMRSVDRIKSFPNPMPLQQIYSRGYYLLLAAMVLLGMSIRFFGLSDDIRGAIDIAIGSALINGAMLYFRVVLRPSS